MKIESPYSMLAVADALELVLRQATPLGPTSIPLVAALGTVLAEDVTAAESLPSFPVSMKDGYAVVAADGPGDYPVIGEVTAGCMPTFTITPGTVAYITTGAPLPNGADAVIMIEATEHLLSQNGRSYVQVHQQVQPNANIRLVGSDMHCGETILQIGERLGAAEIGLLATVGLVNVRTYPRPRIAVLSTGDELVAPDQPPRLGQIRDSNRVTLCAAIAGAGGIPVDLGISRDKENELAEKVQQGLELADILITTGGVSMGKRDLIKPILERQAVVHFGRLRMKPGKPVTFATAEVAGRRKLLFGLPGNPVSSLVTFYLLVVPALRKLAGWRNAALSRVQVVLTQPLQLDKHRPQYHRATIQWDATLHEQRGGYLAASTGNQASSRLLSMRSANALLELPAGDATWPAGSLVTALLLEA